MIVQFKPPASHYRPCLRDAVQALTRVLEAAGHARDMLKGGDTPWHGSRLTEAVAQLREVVAGLDTTIRLLFGALARMEAQHQRRDELH
jgi:hypothetical protein